LKDNLLKIIFRQKNKKNRKAQKKLWFLEKI